MTSDLPSPITTLTPAQQAQVINLVRRAAQSEIMPRYQNLANFEITAKSRDDDLVTQADLDAEAMITRGLLRLFPHAQVVGEEAIAKTPELRDTLSDHEFTFVIDPIDGTWNYSKGVAVFGVILSVLRFGVPVFGILYDPMQDDYVIADHATQSARFVPARGAARTISTAPPETDGGFGWLCSSGADAQGCAIRPGPRFAEFPSHNCVALFVSRISAGRIRAC